MADVKKWPEQPTEYASADEWRAEAVRRFGVSPLGWCFVCPCCGFKATVDDWKKAGAPEGAVAFSCVGRWTGAERQAIGGSGPGPCNYAGGGLIGLNPVAVATDDGEHRVFAFAEATVEEVRRV